MSVVESREAGNAPSPRSFAIAHQRPKASFTGCSKISDYEVLGKLGEGTFGEVHRARSKRTGATVALKKIIMHNEKDGFPITALREIKLLKLLSHRNVLRLEDMAVEHPARSSKSDPNDKRKRPIMYMVTPYMDHDLSGLLDNPSVHFTVPQIKCYMMQLLEGLRYLHDNHILHRDMKAANLLINNKGILQIADFGLARHYEGEVPKSGKGGGVAVREYTSLVVTRWYRPPELLMHLKKYTTAIDMWGVGCVFGEMLVGKPILAGDSDANQLDIIFDLCGTPTDENMPGWQDLAHGGDFKFRPRSGNLSHRFKEHGPGAVSLLKELLKLDYRARINAMDAAQHPYFRSAPFPARPEDLPTFEESHEFDRRKFNDRRAALPPAPKGGEMIGRGLPEGGANGPNAGFNHADGYGGRNGANGSRYPRSRGPPPGDERVPAWHRDRGLPAGLPPRPPPPVDHNGWEGAVEHSDGFRDSRDRPPARGRGGGGVGGGRLEILDTYIPSYDRELPRRDDRRRRDEWDDRRHEWDRRRPEFDDRARASRTRSRSRSPIRDRERDRDRDPYRR
ncbi:kinase-like domain-containing protein [Podospora appendiculata]|uniref:Serine/threonine-protein kinase BUR1 n=1 Tax=Podospora appendiculata TaxID=314037 RepID=A0AAE1CAY8_9PEZI|nr:kinase-like domain-containing protein [Podospora appendiculata]